VLYLDGAVVIRFEENTGDGPVALVAVHFAEIATPEGDFGFGGGVLLPPLWQLGWRRFVQGERNGVAGPRWFGLCLVALLMLGTVLIEKAHVVAVAGRFNEDAGRTGGPPSRRRRMQAVSASDATIIAETCNVGSSSRARRRLRSASAKSWTPPRSIETLRRMARCSNMIMLSSMNSTAMFEVSFAPFFFKGVTLSSSLHHRLFAMPAPLHCRCNTLQRDKRDCEYASFLRFILPNYL